jgi:hypothetical protein
MKQQDNVGKYIEQFQAILDRVGAESVAVGILHEISKDRRMQEIRAERAAKWQARQQATGKTEKRTELMGKQQQAESPVVEVVVDEEPATDRQRRFLEDLGFPAPSKLGKAEASELIGNITAGRSMNQIAA